ncbi:MAG: hypothetical protein OXG04_07565 [Acidobacteria bacterium]|nr:hypothetical protein [Acidobacteriota bacterium]
MADPGVAEETREVAAQGSGEDAAPDGAGGGETDRTQPDTSSSSDSVEPSVADAMRDAVAPGDGGDRREDAGQSADTGSGEPGAPAGSQDPRPGSGESEDAVGAGGEDELPLRNPDSQPESPEPTPENLAAIRAISRRQAEDTREEASEKAAVVVRKEVRRILGLDGKPDFEAESVSHIMGLARDGERVDPELEKELRAELDALGVDLGVVKLRYDSMSKEERRQLTTFEVQQAFLRVVERVETLATQASVSLGHRIRMFDGEARDQLKLVAGLRVLLETEQGKVEQLVVGFRNRMQEETESFEEVVRQERKALAEKVQGLQKAFDDVGPHLKSCEDRAQRITEQLGSVGSAATHAEQEALRVMSELQRVANSGLAVRRLALLGGVVGSAVGGFFAFVVLLLLWAVTSG